MTVEKLAPISVPFWRCKKMTCVEKRRVNENLVYVIRKQAY